jgi:hypothetical protein
VQILNLALDLLINYVTPCVTVKHLSIFLCRAVYLNNEAVENLQQAKFNVEIIHIGPLTQNNDEGKH